MASSSAWAPDWSVTPGEVLADELEARDMSQSELARRMDRPIKTINEIVNGKAAITPDTAVQLELALGISARMWLGLESTFREWQARRRAMAELERHTSWAKAFPVADMRRHGLIDPGVKPSTGELVAALLTFFGVSSVRAWRRQWAAPAVAFRHSPSFASSTPAMSAWLRWGERRAADIACAPFDAGRLLELLTDVRPLSRQEPFADVVAELTARFSACGVALVLTPELSGTRVSGVARWLAPDKALVQLSLRHRTDDHFWFSLYHELVHLLDGSRIDHLDVDDASGSTDTEAERQADRRARDLLIDAERYDEFVRAAHFGAEDVRGLAREVHVAPGIVVGRLQRDGHLAPSRLNGLKKRVSWT
jgi:HTH-type transcriptional regulator/antitoxin HigA